MPWTLAKDGGDPSTVEPSRGDCILRRSLAAILFAASSIFGLAVAIAVIAPAGQGVRVVPHPWRLMLAAGLIAWVCGWLGTLLWSDRRIPPWFIATIMIAPCALVVVTCLVKGDLEGAGYALAMLVYVCWQVRSWTFGTKEQTMPEL